jgi:hypothetical protein
MVSRYMRSGSFWEEPDKKTEKPEAHTEHNSFSAAKTTAGKGLSELLKGMDTSDLLIAAIILFLLIESEDTELIFALAFVLLGGL